MTLESLWYETSPVLYFLSGSLASLYEAGSLLLRLFGILLALVALTILGLRFVWRQRGSDDYAFRKPRSESFFERFDKHW